MKQGFAFEFEPPAGWREFADHGRMVFQSPEGEELIISGAVVDGEGTQETHGQIRSKLLQNSIASMKHAVDVPELHVTRALEKSTTVSTLSHWRIDAETSDKRVLFLQAVVESDRGALLVTFEAPHSETARANFERFLATIGTSTRAN